jgi:hypothetical protein
MVQSGNRLDSGERAMGTGPTDAVSKVTFVVSAFDRNSGRPAWSFELPAEGPLPSVHEKHNLASPSPVTDGERVYAWFATGQIVASLETPEDEGPRQSGHCSALGRAAHNANNANAVVHLLRIAPPRD